MSTVDTTTEVIERRPIPEFLGYHVGADGRVWTSKKLVYGGKAGCRVAYDGPMVEMKQRQSNKSPFYKTITLQNRSGCATLKLVHRLVLEAFIGPCPEGMECRHRDSNPHNNHLWNLLWGTPLENAQDKIKRGTQCHLHGESNGHHKLTDEEIIQIRKQYAAGGVTYRELGEEYDVSPSNIRWVVIKGTWKHI